jgi:Flp pilus assembly protein TadG
MKTVIAKSRSVWANRRGAVAVLAALLLIPLLAFVALSVDIGWMATTKSTLQNAADSAAAAGARQLTDNFAAYYSPSQTQGHSLIDSAELSALSYSQKFCGYNGAGGVTSLKLLSSDAVFGFTNAQNSFTPVTAYSNYPNTVKVTVRRDASANGRLPFFFAPAIGEKDTALTATSSATVYTGLVTAFGPVSQVSGGSGGVGTGVASGSGGGTGGGTWGDSYWSNGSSLKGTLLPVAFDVNTWNSFFATGVSPDGSITRDATGTPMIHIYPSPKQSPGNFGLLCIGPWTNADPTYKNWILNGPSASDLQYLANSGAYPVSLSSPKPWKGTPGLRSTLGSAFSAIIGQPRLLPLFQPKTMIPYQAASGNGSNTTYSIVGFAGVTVTSVSGNGTNMDICVKPCSVLDPTAVFDATTIYPAGAQPSGQMKAFTFVTSKLSH